MLVSAYFYSSQIIFVVTPVLPQLLLCKISQFVVHLRSAMVVNFRVTAGHRGSVTSSSITDLWEWETCDVLHVRKTALHCSQEVTFRSNTDGKSGGGDSYVHSDMMATTAITFSKSLTHPRRRPPIALLTLPLPSAQLTSRRK